MIYKGNLYLIVAVMTMTVCVGVIVFLRPIFGIDFTGGSLLEFRSREPNSQAVTTVLTEKFSLPATVQVAGDDAILIRTAPLDQTTHEQIVTELRSQGLLEEELRFESIGPTIGAELRRKALLAISLSIIAIFLYLAYEFRSAAGIISPWKFGVAAALALAHDLLLVLAIFVVLGRTHGVTIDTLFVTAMLAILGYSVNDTIVIFNRVRTEWLATRTGSLAAIMNRAARLSLVRSLNTSLATLLVLIVLLMFGGTTIRWFIVALAAGTITGTYSSLFVALPILHALTRR